VKKNLLDWTVSERVHHVLRMLLMLLLGSVLLAHIHDLLMLLALPERAIILLRMWVV
jgi:Tfp pilus assembly protein PilN